MIPLFSSEEFDSAKTYNKLPCKCRYCDKTYYKTKHRIQLNLNPNHHGNGDFCSVKCGRKYVTRNNRHTVICLNCGKSFVKQLYQIKKHPNHFCSQSCAATYNNARKTVGCRRSKLEAYLETQLTTLYPKLEIHFNRKDAINSELDIYIPALHLAFELNGIFHYEPIYGTDKLNQIQNNNQNKFARCNEQNISLCIIDTSTQKYFKPSSSARFLNIITNIINDKMSKNVILL